MHFDVLGAESQIEIPRSMLNSFFFLQGRGGKRLHSKILSCEDSKLAPPFAGSFSLAEVRSELKIMVFSEVGAQWGHEGMNRFSCQGGCHGWQQFLLQRWLSFCTSFLPATRAFGMIQRGTGHSLVMQAGDQVEEFSSCHTLLLNLSVSVSDTDTQRMALGIGDLGRGVSSAMGKGSSLCLPHTWCCDTYRSFVSALKRAASSELWLWHTVWAWTWHFLRGLAQMRPLILFEPIIFLFFHIFCTVWVKLLNVVRRNRFSNSCC